MSYFNLHSFEIQFMYSSLHLNAFRTFFTQLYVFHNIIQGLCCKMSRVMSCGEEVELFNSLAYLGGVVNDDGAKFLNSCRVRIGPGAASSHGRFGGDYVVSAG